MLKSLFNHRLCVAVRTAAAAVLLFTASATASAQKFPGLGDTPQMGWSTWNKFQGNINEDIIKGIADAMVSSGLRDAGYTYINIDDCWHGERDADGFIQCDPERFPSGMKALADYVHSKGLKLGIYSDAGTETCAGEPGSLGHEYQDALQYARWGIDYLKYDWCNTEQNYVTQKCAYTLMSEALHAAGRPIFLSMCEWGSSMPWKWAREVGNSWRTTPDIWCSFDSLRVFPTYTQYSVMDCIHANDSLRIYAGKGHWNDPDMLECGNGMTINEDRAHFSMWCMMASPLILGNDIRSMSDEVKAILTNAEAIAINQDTLGVQCLKFGEESGLYIYFKPLAGGDWALCFLNPTKNDVTYAINWQRFNLTDEEVSGMSTAFDKNTYTIYNVWTHKKEGKTSKADKVAKKIKVPSHDAVMYRLVCQNSK